MKVYLDLCCLKRPFDAQEHLRVRMETEAVLRIQHAVAAGRIAAVRSVVHDIENAQNSDAKRARTVAAWLNGLDLALPTQSSVADRAIALENAGFRAFEAYHLAWAERLNADVFVTCDDGILATARRNPGIIGVRVVDPVTLAGELEQWT